MITLPEQPTVRQPRGLVKVNGQPCSGWLELSFDINEFSQPDTFSVTFAISGLPESMDLLWWGVQTEIEVELFVGFPLDPDSYTDADLDSMLLGVVDDISGVLPDRRLTVTGRDFTARLMDSKTSEKYPNLTASAVATKMAEKYGLTPVVTATTEKIGRYYEIDHVDLQIEQTEWDVLTWLARQEQFSVFIRGRELHFQPYATEDQTPFIVQYAPQTDAEPQSATVQNITFGRTLTVAKDVEVTVTTWGSKTKKTIQRKSTRRGGSGKTRSTEVQKYSYRIGNLSADEAQRRADQLAAEITKHRMKISVSGPADNKLMLDDSIKLVGTGTAWDQVYFPDSINRSLTFEGGYTWEISAKNQSPESEPTL